MRIYEYEAKELLEKAGVPVPRAHLAAGPDEVGRAARKLGRPAVLKPQTLLKARGKSGLIGFADTPEQAIQAARLLLGRVHRGERVEQILVEERVDISAELYLGIVVDYAQGHPTLLACRSGGVDIEAAAAGRPDLVMKIAVSPATGLNPTQAEKVGRFLAAGLPPGHAGTEIPLREISLALARLFTERDGEMLEINPLAVTTDGQVLALDAAMAIDEDALFRQPDLVRRRGQAEEDYLQENDHRRRGWTYLKMEGDIGILSSGAGITMAILDLMREAGGRPANFLDTAQMDRKGIYDAFKIFHGDPGIKTVLVNIFAGLNRCDDLAEGIRDFLTEYSTGFAVVVRMIGNREEEGKAILRSIGLSAISGLEDAVAQAIKLNGEQS
ncbi:MAG: succinate--CoA ligase subunit beta [Thermodesulfobacteriota bacterium]